MTKHADLPPLDPEVALLLAGERSRSRGPSGAERARLRARLAASLALPVAGVAASSSAAASTVSKLTVGGAVGGVWGKSALALIVVALGTGATVGFRHLTRRGAADVEMLEGQLASPVGGRAPQRPSGSNGNGAEVPPVSQPRGSTTAPTWSDERRLVQEARAALVERRADQALDRINLHAERFPTGLLAEEREALRVQALVNLGRLQEARAAAVHFQALYPQSVHHEAVRRALPAPRGAPGPFGE